MEAYYEDIDNIYQNVIAVVAPVLCCHFVQYISLTHWFRATHICVCNLTIIGSENGLSPGRCQAIIWTNAGMLLILPVWTNFSEILIAIHISSLKKIHLKLSSAKLWPSCIGINVLIGTPFTCVLFECGFSGFICAFSSWLFYWCKSKIATFHDCLGVTTIVTNLMWSAMTPP